MPPEVEALDHEKYRQMLRCGGDVAITAAAEAVSQFYGRLLATRGLHLVDAAIVRVCGHRGPMTVPDLARELCTTRGVIDQHVKQLLERRLVARVQLEGEPRARRLAITDEGRRMLVEIVAGWDAAQNYLAQAVGPRWQWLCDELAEIIAIVPAELDGSTPPAAERGARRAH